MNNQLLAKYLGLCWHEWEQAGVVRGSLIRCKLCGETQRAVKVKQGFGYTIDYPPNPDFTTHAGYGLLHDEITKRGEWSKFYVWLASEDVWDLWQWSSPEDRAMKQFHENPKHADKSTLISEALEAGVIGGEKC